jgi:hypothetical protein
MLVAWRGLQSRKLSYRNVIISNNWPRHWKLLGTMDLSSFDGYQNAWWTIGKNIYGFAGYENIWCAISANIIEI